MSARHKRTLSDRMDFDHVIEILPDGSIIDRPDIWSPDLCDDELDARDHWILLDGYSRQDRYSGPIMHPSEYIGGAMERDILAEPGVYVALVAYYSPDENDDPNNYDDVGGWAVARLIEREGAK